jgi:hypothetical protein
LVVAPLTDASVLIGLAGLKKQRRPSFITFLILAAPDSETWDVVVVGLHDPRPDKLGHLARHLARVCEMPIDELVEALQEGEVPVYSGLRRHEAERAAHQLDAFGAAVDLRLAVVTSGVYPILKPDAERRSGTAVGGFIDDSATPPRIVDSQVGVLPLEPPAAGDHIGPVAAAPPMVQGAAGRRAASASASPVVTRRRTIGESPSSVPPSHPPVGHPAAGRPARAGVSLDDDPLGALTSGLERLSADDALGMLGSLDDDRDRVQPRGGDWATPRDGVPAPQEPPAAATPAPRRASQPVIETGRADDAPPPPPRRGPIVATAPVAKPTPVPAKPVTPKARADPFAPPSGSSDLQLDYEAAGMSRPPTPTLSRAVKPGHSAVLPRRTRATDVGGTGAAARGFGRASEASRRPLMGPEPVSATLFGLVAGLALGLFAAVLLQKGAENEAIVGFEAEMQQALAAPDDVAAGQVRAANAIEADLDAAYAEVRRSFLLRWLAIGVPIGLVLGRLKRS